MEQVIVEFDTGNAAFCSGHGPEETARIMVHIAGRIRDGWSRGIVRDSNGNRIGEWSAYFPESED